MTMTRRRLLLGLAGTALSCAGPSLGTAAANSKGVPSADWLRIWPRTEFGLRTIAFDEVFVSRKVPKDGIKAIDRPDFVFGSGARQYIAPTEPVISIVAGTEARAYPLGILLWHEVVNDIVGGEPVAITYSPLSNSFGVYKRALRRNDPPLTFAVSGSLRQGNTILFDRETESWWQQYDGRCILGALTGRHLRPVAARLESLDAFLARAANGRVLFPEPSTQPNQPRPQYGRNPYGSYDAREKPFGANAAYTGYLPAMERLLVVGHRGWPFTLLRQKGRLETGNLVLTWEAGQNSPVNARLVADGQDVGNVLARKRQGGRLVDVPYNVPFAFAFATLDPFNDVRRS